MFVLEHVSPFHFLGKQNSSKCRSFCRVNIGGIRFGTFTRDSGCLSRDDFLVIREGYHILILLLLLLLGTVLHCTSWSRLFPVVN